MSNLISSWPISCLLNIQWPWTLQLLFSHSYVNCCFTYSLCMDMGCWLFHVRMLRHEARWGQETKSKATASLLAVFFLCHDLKWSIPMPCYCNRYSIVVSDLVFYCCSRLWNCLHSSFGKCFTILLLSRQSTVIQCNCECAFVNRCIERFWKTWFCSAAIFCCCICIFSSCCGRSIFCQQICRRFISCLTD